MRAPKGLLLVACAVVTIWASLISASHAARECTLDKFACQIKIISWVEVWQQGKAARTISKSALEKYIRLRVRNDISFLEHETRQMFRANKFEPDSSPTPLDRKIAEAYQTGGWKAYGELLKKEKKKRSTIDCYVWTVGENNAIAVNIDCSLESWYEKFTNPEYRSERLGLTHKENLKSYIKKQLQAAVESIAIDLYNEREGFTDLEHGTQ